MDREKKAKLDEYDQRIIEWCLKNEHITEYLETKGYTLRELRQHKLHKGTTPFPLTKEELSHRTEIEVELKKAAEKLDDTPQYLLFLAPPVQGRGVKFVK